MVNGKFVYLGGARGGDVLNISITFFKRTSWHGCMGILVIGILVIGILVIGILVIGVLVIGEKRCIGILVY